MSSTLSDIMNEVTSNTEIPTQTAPSASSNGNNGSWYTSIPLWLTVLGIVALAIYFMPFLLDYLSLPEQIVEEEVKKEVNTRKRKKAQKKIIQDIVEEREAQALEERGFCYIGTDRGVRSCIQVNPGDKCMSGQIFPRRDVCVNPNLRL